MTAGLPVYQLFPAPAEPAAAEEVASASFGLGDVDRERLEGRIVGRSGWVTNELDRAGVGIWVADAKHLWNRSKRPSPIPTKEAHATAAERLGRLDLRRRFDNDGPFARVHGDRVLKAEARNAPIRRGAVARDRRD
jgi:hypothetical protein